MSETIDKISNDGDGLLLWEFDSLFDKGFQVSFIAEFGDDVAIISGTVDVVALENVGMIKFFEGVDFAFEHFLFGFSLYAFDIDDFDGDRFFGFFIDAPVDDRTETFPNDILETVGVVLYFFSKIIIGIELPIHFL